MPTIPAPRATAFPCPAEWAPHARTWMCWPCRTEAWGGPEGLLRAKQAYARVARAISTFEPVTMAARPQDAAEAKLAMRGQGRDFRSAARRFLGARFAGRPSCADANGARAGVQWQFNAWGNKYHPYAERCAASRPASLEGERRARSIDAPLVCEGGAIHSDGEGTLLTTEQMPAQLQPQSESDAAGGRGSASRSITGARTVIWLGEGFSDDETDGHVDNIACFVGAGARDGRRAAVASRIPIMSRCTKRSAA